jgi:putative FmdB family regulatory protein
VPTYQYACTACDHRFEQVQSFSDPSLSECPECSGRLRKLYGSVGVVFKGSGFYRTDSRAKSSASETAGSSASSSEKKESGGAKESTTSSSGGAEKSPSTSSSTSTTTPAAKAS